jgi:hypothetical protein|tara:strand:+ start:5082 stop:5450 length:369 start_codon:yes stop_codon:yes gene_type:complete
MTSWIEHILEKHKNWSEATNKEIVLMEINNLLEDMDEGDLLGFAEYNDLNIFESGLAFCVLCDHAFYLGESGNELGFCIKCQEKEDFPYDLDKYYADYDNDKVAFKGFETMDRGLLENYKKE